MRKGKRPRTCGNVPFSGCYFNIRLFSSETATIAVFMSIIIGGVKYRCVRGLRIGPGVYQKVEYIDYAKNNTRTHVTSKPTYSK